MSKKVFTDSLLVYCVISSCVFVIGSSTSIEDVEQRHSPLLSRQHHQSSSTSSSPNEKTLSSLSSQSSPSVLSSSSSPRTASTSSDDASPLETLEGSPQLLDVPSSSSSFSSMTEAIVPKDTIITKIDTSPSSSSSLTSCSLEETASLFSEEDVLKKAIEHFTQRHGQEKVRNLIQEATGMACLSQSLPLFPPLLTLRKPLIPVARTGITLDKTEGQVKSNEVIDENSNNNNDNNHDHHQHDINPDDQEKQDGNEFGDNFKGTIDIGLNIDSKTRNLNLRKLVQETPKVEPNVPRGPVVVYDRVASHLPVPGSGRFLIIPGRRQRPFGSKVRVLARNMVREVKFTTSPFMSVFEALKQAEIKVQYQYPELKDQRVISIESSEEADGHECFKITRVGRVTEDDSHDWIIKVYYADSRTGATELVYEGRCVPGKDKVLVRPLSTIDLVYTSKSSEMSL